MNPRHHSLAATIRSRTDSIFSLLEAMVLIQSGSRNKRGVDAVGRLIRSELKDLPLTVETVAQQDVGDHLVARSQLSAAGRSGVLMVGHMDTVFGEDSPFNGYRSGRRHCYGPGVIDMKGGLVAGITALRALERAGRLNHIPITFIFNADEEIGSTTSRDLIHREAERHAFAFVLECGGLNGEVVTGRKGNLAAVLDVQGKAGHAAFAGKDKASAILALARRVIDIEALNDPGRGVSANVGVITGGTTSNTVAEAASAHIDLRFIETGDDVALTRRLERIANRSTDPGVRCRVSIRSRRPPMPASAGNRKLFAVIDKTARSLGMQVAEEFRHGVSDANTIADAGTPVVDGLGPIGAKDHSDEEYMVKQSLVDRSILLACAIDDCWNDSKPKD